MGNLRNKSKGKLIACDICGFEWYGAYTGKIMKQRDLNVCFLCYDSMTLREMEEQHQRNLTNRQQNVHIF